MRKHGGAPDTEPQAPSADVLVKAWYTLHFLPTGLGLKAIDWSLVERAGGVVDKDVLNCGCGYPMDEFVLGRTARSWTAIDFCAEGIRRCQEEFRFPHRIEYVLGDLRSLPFGDGAFDLVLSFSTVDHVAEGRDRVHAEAFRVARPGAAYILTYPNRAFYPDGRADAYGDFGFEHRFAPDEAEAEVRAAGFEVAYHDTLHDRSGLIARKPWVMPLSPDGP